MPKQENALMNLVNVPMILLRDLDKVFSAYLGSCLVFLGELPIRRKYVEEPSHSYNINLR